MRRDRLQGLADLAGVVRDRDLARLAGTAAACRALGTEIAAARRSLADRAAETAALRIPDPALRSGADAAWREAERRRMQALGVALAGAAAARETAKVAALKALGRADVLDRLKAGKL